VDDTVVKVRDTGSPHVIDVVQAWERKLIHDRVAETATDLETKSEGQDPTRRVAIQTA
jgi:predicted RNA-binding protein Jag